MIFGSITAAKPEVWQQILDGIKFGESCMQNLVYDGDLFHVSCDGWTWSVDAV